MHLFCVFILRFKRMTGTIIFYILKGIADYCCQQCLFCFQVHYPALRTNFPKKYCPSAAIFSGDIQQSPDQLYAASNKYILSLKLQKGLAYDAA